MGSAICILQIEGERYVNISSYIYVCNVYSVELYVFEVWTTIVFR
jgi:hypothetical protein